MRKQVAILGAGISGLALAWFLEQRFGDQLEISILEKNARSGGWIETLDTGEFLFELGPRSCRVLGADAPLLRLVSAVGLQEELIRPGALSKYLYCGQRLRSFRSLLFSPWTALALARDLTMPRGEEEDETIASFFSRRIGSKLTERLIDPMVSGIFAGDIHKLSLRSCFPRFYNQEKETRSLLRGALGKRAPVDCFSFRGGMQQLIEMLQCSLKNSPSFSTEVTSLRPGKRGMEIFCTGGERREVDFLFSTIPTPSLALLIEEQPKLSSLLSSIPSASLAVVNVGYRRPVWQRRGFGHLIPSSEKEPILGAVWDSSVFPEHNRKEGQTRFSVMIGGAHFREAVHQPSEHLIDMALKSLRKQLGISETPAFTHVHFVKDAIPQYHLGHHRLVKEIEKESTFFSPVFSCLGTSLYGVSVSDCVAQAEKAARSFSLF